MQIGINGVNATATVTEISAPVKDPRAASTPLSQDAGVRERCALLGIDWFDKAPTSDPAAAELLPPEIAVRLGAVPVSFDGNKLLVAMLDPLDTAAVDEIGTVTSRTIRRIGLESKLRGLGKEVLDHVTGCLMIVDKHFDQHLVRIVPVNFILIFFFIKTPLF